MRSQCKKAFFHVLVIRLQFEAAQESLFGRTDPACAAFNLPQYEPLKDLIGPEFDDQRLRATSQPIIQIVQRGIAEPHDKRYVNLVAWL